MNVLSVNFILLYQSWWLIKLHSIFEHGNSIIKLNFMTFYETKLYASHLFVLSFQVLQVIYHKFYFGFDDEKFTC